MVERFHRLIDLTAIRPTTMAAIRGSQWPMEPVTHVTITLTAIEAATIAATPEAPGSSLELPM
jgi:hypothetical protein